MVRVERLDGNPIIRPTMLSGSDGDNINGPSLIRAPDWLEGRLATYYLYFAHHHGTYIRLAYADKLVGPWTVYEPGTLRLENTRRDYLGNRAGAKHRHLASPDIHVDHQAREIRMYFHGGVYASDPAGSRSRYLQRTFVATSSDGLQFAVRPEPLGNAYFRVFMWRGAYYALAMPGVFYRSVDGLQRFVKGPTLFTPDMRHAAVLVDGHTLWVFYSVAGDSPERILLSIIDLSLPWTEWAPSKPVVVLEPETEWEGVHHPVRPSIRGPARQVRELRDPAIFAEAGKSYLLYSVAGESGIAIAELHGSEPRQIDTLVGRELGASAQEVEHVADGVLRAMARRRRRFRMSAGRSRRAAELIVLGALRRPPQASYVICGMPRSGTVLLAGLLASTGHVGRAREWFDRIREPEGARANYAPFVARVIRRRSVRRVFGVKFVHGQLWSFLDALRSLPGNDGLSDRELLQVFPRPRFVWLQRSDVVAQAVSWWRAIKTNEWSAAAGTKSGKGGKSTDVPAFNFEEIANLETEIVRGNERWEQWFAANEIDPLRIVYEELAENPVEVARRVLAFLGIELPESVAIRPLTARQTDALSEEWIARYRELTPRWRSSDSSG